MCAVPDNECLSGRARSPAPRIWLLGIYFILSLLRPPAALPQTQHPHPHLLLHHHNQLACYHWPFMMHGASSNVCLPFTLEVHVPVCDAQGETIHLLGISWQWGGVGGHSQTIKCTYLMFYLSLHGLWCLPKNYSEHFKMLFRLRKCLSLMEQIDVWSSANRVVFSVVTQLRQARLWTVADCQCWWSYESITVISNVCFSLY